MNTHYYIKCDEKELNKLLNKIEKVIKENINYKVFIPYISSKEYRLEYLPNICGYVDIIFDKLTEYKYCITFSYDLYSDNINLLDNLKLIQDAYIDFKTLIAKITYILNYAKR